MSLSRIALRICAVEAIKGQTLVGDNVLDTPNGAFDIQADGSLRSEEEKPFVSVYTDQAKAEGISGRTLSENGLCDIIFEMGLSAAMLDTDRETGASVLVGINIPASDGSQEFFLDIVQRQIFDALNDPSNPWAEIYRGLHYRVVKIDYAGARNTDNGQKLAGHQVRLTVDLADDPIKGETPDAAAPFMAFLAKMAESSNPAYVRQGEVIRSLISAEEDEWQALRRRKGMTAAELLALGSGPLAGDLDQLAPVSEVTIEVDTFNTVTVADP